MNECIFTLIQCLLAAGGAATITYLWIFETFPLRFLIPTGASLILFIFLIHKQNLIIISKCSSETKIACLKNYGEKK